MRPKQVITKILLPGLGLLLILWACNTPSIPMPPPSPESFTFIQSAQTGYYELEISANQYIPEGAEVMVKNLDTGLFVGGPAGAGGAYHSMPFAAELDDIIQVSFVTDSGEGGVTCLVLGNIDGTPDEDPRCGD